MPPAARHRTLGLWSVLSVLSALIWGLTLTSKPAFAIEPEQKQAPQTSTSCRAPDATHSAALLSATAALLAGHDVTDAKALTSIATAPAVKLHQQSLRASFEKLDAGQLNSVRAFAQAHLKTADQPLYYPFSGPDLLYAEAFFPQARRYLLTGLEPIGDVPLLANLQADELSASLTELRKSLYTILNFSFFKTNDMRLDLRRNRLQGVVPLLLTFAGNAGFQVQSARFFYVNSDGTVCNTSAAVLASIRAPQIAGVALVLKRRAASATQEIIYLQCDMGDTALTKTPQYLQIVRKLQHGASFIKSASYLLHKDYFSRTRQLILDTSPIVLQDDSGVPYTYFADSQWQRKLFGSYSAPIALFAAHRQPDLVQAFNSIGSASLDFGIGYRHAKQNSALLLFQRKAAP
jgi:Na+-transporting methylmalonyl-CoA/oxaloacetate decarboxylase gamma subunit